MPPYPAILPLHYQVMCGLLLIWWLAFLYPVLAPADIESGLMDAESATASGNLYNQLLTFGFAGLGLFHARRALGILQNPMARLLLLLAGLYCLWSGMTLFWSEDANLTIRRLTAFLLLLAGSFGLGAGFYANIENGVRSLAKHVVFAAVVCVVMLVGLRLWDSSLAELLDPEFSLKGSTRISYYAFPIGYAISALIALYPGRLLLQLGTTAALFLVMVILKGRTMVADALATALLVGSQITQVPLLRGAMLAAGVALTSVLADLVTGGSIFINLLVDGYGSIANWLPWLTLGEGLRNITSLSGRLPLWQMLYPYIDSRLWVGRGFGAFWNPARFIEAYQAAGWRAVSAHNGFLDELLATGLIGLSLYLAFWLAGMVTAFRLGRLYSLPFGYMVAGWLLLFLLFNSLESIFQMFFQLPTFLSLIALFALIPQTAPAPASLVMDAVEHPYPLQEQCGEPA